MDCERVARDGGMEAWIASVLRGMVASMLRGVGMVAWRHGLRGGGDGWARGGVACCVDVACTAGKEAWMDLGVGGGDDGNLRGSGGGGMGQGDALLLLPLVE